MLTNNQINLMMIINNQFQTQLRRIKRHSNKQKMLSKTTYQLKSLLSVPLYFTMKSKRQFTPNLFQNPKLTKHGIIERIPKSYDYTVPQTTPNKHLYWNRTVQNRARRVKYNQHKLQKLRINPIHQSGNRTFNRSLEEILHETCNLTIVRTSLNRTFANLTEVLIRFKNDLSVDDKQIVITTINDIHERFLPSLSLYHFSSYIQIRCLAGLPCTQKIFVHFYKYIQQFSEESQNGDQVKKFSLKVFLKILKYVFNDKSATYLKKNKEMLYKNREMFKLFEDNDARFISLEELVPFTYSRDEVINELNDDQVKNNLKYINLLPGGKVLLQKLTE